jgi:hypothetical protein
LEWLKIESAPTLGVPKFCNLPARRARRSAGLRSQLKGVILETSDPNEQFSAGGPLRVFAPWGYRSCRRCR